MVRTAISASTAIYIENFLKDVVTKGSGKSAAIPRSVVIGMPARDKKWDPVQGAYSKDRYVDFFVGYVRKGYSAPIVVLVLIDEPRGNFQASNLAAPVFARIAEFTMDYLDRTL